MEAQCSSHPMSNSRLDLLSLLLTLPQTLDSQMITSPSTTSRKTASGPVQAQHKVIESASDGVTIFNFLSHPPITPELEDNGLPGLPSEKLANELLETTYIYTQGRYCLVDWVQVREWHQHREALCNRASLGDPEAQIGML